MSLGAGKMCQLSATKAQPVLKQLDSKYPILGKVKVSVVKPRHLRGLR